ncbi:MAG: thioesterase [Rhodobiaceae bacterium]|nr:thioesterase [Rhodobiaceae bacterium]|tara:strand:- start:637 stop:1137 length:501 start_codon:yes stop_codon:yes gene_type:complete
MPDAQTLPFEAPIRQVEPQWIDLNGHMNMAYYNLLFDEALDTLFTELDIGWNYTQKGEGSFFTAEIHVCYLDELKLGDPVRITFQIIDADEKRLHLFGHMYHAEKGYLAATSEQMCIHVSMKTRKTAPMPKTASDKAIQLKEEHAALGQPEQTGKTIGIRRKKEAN